MSTLREPRVGGGTVPVFEVTFRAHGSAAYDERLVEAFYDSYEGLISWREGQLFLTLEFVASEPESVCRTLVESVENTLKVRLVEADFDLVDIPEIASRTRRSRQSIQQIVTGRRRNTFQSQFPEPVKVLAGKRIWDWGTLVAWLKKEGILGEDEPSRLSREQLYVLNAWLCRRSAFFASIYGGSIQAGEEYFDAVAAVAGSLSIHVTKFVQSWPLTLVTPAAAVLRSVPLSLSLPAPLLTPHSVHEQEQGTSKDAAAEIKTVGG